MCREWGICLPFATFFRLALIAVVGGLMFFVWWAFYRFVVWWFDRLDGVYLWFVSRMQKAAEKKDGE